MVDYGGYIATAKFLGNKAMSDLLLNVDNAIKNIRITDLGLGKRITDLNAKITNLMKALNPNDASAPAEKQPLKKLAEIRDEIDTMIKLHSNDKNHNKITKQELAGIKLQLGNIEKHIGKDNDGNGIFNVSFEQLLSKLER